MRVLGKGELDCLLEINLICFKKKFNGFDESVLKKIYFLRILLLFKKKIEVGFVI